MVIREWRARASTSDPEAYADHFRANVLPELLTLPGFLGAYLCKRLVDDKIEFVVLTRWASIASIRRFAGATIDSAVVEPGAVAALLDFDAEVRHYEIVEEADVTMTQGSEASHSRRMELPT